MRLHVSLQGEAQDRKDKVAGAIAAASLPHSDNPLAVLCRPWHYIAEGPASNILEQATAQCGRSMGNINSLQDRLSKPDLNSQEHVALRLALGLALAHRREEEGRPWFAEIKLAMDVVNSAPDNNSCDIECLSVNVFIPALVKQREFDGALAQLDTILERCTAKPGPNSHAVVQCKRNRVQVVCKKHDYSALHNYTNEMLALSWAMFTAGSDIPLKIAICLELATVSGCQAR